MTKSILDNWQHLNKIITHNYARSATVSRVQNSASWPAKFTYINYEILECEDSLPALLRFSKYKLIIPHKIGVLVRYVKFANFQHSI